MLVSSGDGDTICVGNVNTGAPIGDPCIDYVTRSTRRVLTTSDRRPVVMSGSRDGVWNVGFEWTGIA